MRGAPPVQALSSAFGAWRFVQCLLWAIAVGSPVVWISDPWVGAGWRSILCGAAAALLAWVCAWRLDRQPPRRLVWDGTAWATAALGSAAIRGRAQLMIDLGHWLLVRFDADPPPRPSRVRPQWMPLSQVDNRAAWHGLRVALHAPAAQHDPDRVPQIAQPNE